MSYSKLLYNRLYAGGYITNALLFQLLLCLVSEFCHSARRIPRRSLSLFLSLYLFLSLSLTFRRVSLEERLPPCHFVTMQTGDQLVHNVLEGLVRSGRKSKLSTT
jgi:hypothetical protein